MTGLQRVSKNLLPIRSATISGPTPAPSPRTIATIGLDNVVIVDSDDSILIAAKGKIQDVKKIAEEMKKRGC